MEGGGKVLIIQKVFDLERTRTTIKNFMEDDCVNVQLPTNTYEFQHFKSVAASLMREKRRFKIGTTNDPYERFCVRSYAYTRERAQRRDSARYDAMVVVLVHHQRDVVAMCEHALLDHCCKHMPCWCANRKLDFDNHMEYDGGDESDHDSQGPHFLYFSHGDLL